MNRTGRSHRGNLNGIFSRLGNWMRSLQVQEISLTASGRISLHPRVEGNIHLWMVVNPGSARRRFIVQIFRSAAD